jgi:hypothetical protein
MYRVLFLTFHDKRYSRSAALFETLSSSKNYLVLDLWVEKPRFRNMIQLRREILQNTTEDTQIIVMSPCHVLVPYLKCLVRRRIVLDAGWPLSDSSRIRRSSSLNRKMRDRIVDLLAFSLADIVLLESEAQVARQKKKKYLNASKIFCSYTNVDVTRFGPGTFRILSSDKKGKGEENFEKVEKPVAFFRGKYNEEAGIEFIQSVFQTNEKWEFVLACPDLPKTFVRSSNIVYFEEYLKDDDLALLYEKADLCIGQFGNEDRIDYSIAHKVFESAFFEKSMICSDSKAVKEIFTDQSFFFCDKESFVETLEKIYSAWKMDKGLLKKSGVCAKREWAFKCSQSAFEKNFTEILVQGSAHRSLHGRFHNFRH